MMQCRRLVCKYDVDCALPIEDWKEAGGEKQDERDDGRSWDMIPIPREIYPAQRVNITNGAM
jgi:hypothetical protein